MKTIKVSDCTHRKLTQILGNLMAKTGKTQTYSEAIDALIAQSVYLPTETFQEIDEAIREFKQFSNSTREEFIKFAITETIGNMHTK